ncbi:MAG: 4Fe-4S dicluster domain-containing protein [Polaromonas sp.]|jgi:tetrathionate reductase subunit B|nr:4Fe-4S dicluster domain-containing protein [Polaromonas sp.]MBL0253402.1 4Fe-4S dicluster domain-containing protein [Polaromonas sp.]MBP6088900.1 4Fe-4S dicluster domain-containing protein [Polaromonas sp.]MBP6155425.1 4Fe-4S dicluster domain-containing protein [Polaromonas sp.]MBP7114939.1 4Fe-4S dicluster domain-containing protein [Polaromonas sp.]
MNSENSTPENTNSVDTQAKPNASRRGFLGIAATAGIAGALIAPGVRLIEVAQAAPATDGASKGADSKVRWGMLIDSGKCSSGCTDCVTACNTENGLSGGTLPTDSQWIRKIEIKEVKTGKTQSLPMMCQHCAEPPCVDVCPTGASFKRVDGIVLVDKHICIGCRYCVMACPYKARSFVHEPLSNQKPDVPRGMGTVEGCTLCVHKVDKGESPACVSACASAGHEAILFGDLNNPESDIAKKVATLATRQVRENLDLNTGVRYIGI